MISQLAVYTERGTSPIYVYPFEKNADLILDDIQGVGPMEAQINTVKMGLEAGERYNSQTWPTREIMLHFSGISIGNRYQTAAVRLRRAFNPGEKVTLQFDEGIFPSGIRKNITGIVQRSELDTFTETPGMSFYIKCLNPWFRASSGLSNQKAVTSAVTNWVLNSGNGIAWPEIDMDIEQHQIRSILLDDQKGHQFKIEGLEAISGSGNYAYLQININTKPGERAISIKGGGGSSSKALTYISRTLDDWDVFKMQAFKTLTVTIDYASGTSTFRYSTLEATYTDAYDEVII